MSTNTLRNIVFGSAIATAIGIAVASIAGAAFIKAQGDARVYMIVGNSVCHVRNDDQLAVLARGSYQEMSQFDFSRIITNTRFSGDCEWPAGFYKGRNSDQIYKVDVWSSCWIQDMSQLRRLGGTRYRTIDNIDSIPQIQNSSGECMEQGVVIQPPPRTRTDCSFCGDNHLVPVKP